MMAYTTGRAIEASPQVYARIAGALYLIIIALGLFAEGFVNNRFIVSGDPTATAHNIMASQLLWRMSAAGNMIVPLCAVPLMLIFYVLLRPVSRTLALLAVLFNLVSLAVEAVSKLYLLEALSFLGPANYLSAFGPQQLQVLAYLALKSHDLAFNIALLFFGCTCIVEGILIFRSAFLPRFVGIAMQIAGFSYLTACFSALFAPAFADLIIPAILVPPFIGESSFCLWLLFKGVNVRRWNARARM